MKKILIIFLLCIASLGFKCGGDKGESFTPNKAERGESWDQFKHDTSFNVWVFNGDRPREHRANPQGPRVFWDGEVSAEEFSIIDSGLSEMLQMCRQNTVNWQPADIWTKFVYFQKPSDFKILFVPSNYTLQEGEAAGCAGMITGPQGDCGNGPGTCTTAGTVGGMIEINGAPASKGGLYIIIPKQSPEQLARTECKLLMKNAVKHEAEHLWMSNSPSLYFSFANDGAGNGGHPYCRGNQPL